MSVQDVILLLGAQTRLSREQKMNELGIFVATAIAGILWSVVSYSMGFKDGQRQGFKRGRSLTRHASSQAVSE